MSIESISCATHTPFANEYIIKSAGGDVVLPTVRKDRIQASKTNFENTENLVDMALFDTEVVVREFHEEPFENFFSQIPHGGYVAQLWGYRGDETFFDHYHMKLAPVMDGYTKLVVQKIVDEIHSSKKNVRKNMLKSLFPYLEFHPGEGFFLQMGGEALFGLTDDCSELLNYDGIRKLQRKNIGRTPPEPVKLVEESGFHIFEIPVYEIAGVTPFGQNQSGYLASGVRYESRYFHQLEWKMKGILQDKIGSRNQVDQRVREIISPYVRVRAS